MHIILEAESVPLEVEFSKCSATDRLKYIAANTKPYFSERDDGEMTYKCSRQRRRMSTRAIVFNMFCPSLVNTLLKHELLSHDEVHVLRLAVACMPMTDHRNGCYMKVFYNLKCHGSADNNELVKLLMPLNTVIDNGEKALRVFQNSLHFVDLTKDIRDGSRETIARFTDFFAFGSQQASEW